MRNIIIKSVVNKLKGITTDEDNFVINDNWAEDEDHQPVLQFFAIWRENLLYAEEDIPYNLPAVFFEFEPIKPLPLPHKKREATVVMKLHILTAKSQDDIDGDYHEDKAYKLIEVINKALTLHFYESEAGGHDSLTNFNSQEDYGEPEIDHYTESFRLRAWDDTSYTPMDTVTPDAELRPGYLDPTKAKYIIVWEDNQFVITQGYIPNSTEKTIQIARPDGSTSTWVLINSVPEELESGVIGVGEHKEIFAPDATYEVRLNGDVVDSGPIASGKLRVINVEAPAPEDATWTLKDTDGVFLKTGTIPSGEFDDIEAPNATVNINKSDGTPISSQVAKSGETKGYNVADSVVLVKDQNQQVLASQNIPAETDSEINVNIPVQEGWIPPADWSAYLATMDSLISDGDNGFVALLMVHPYSINELSILIRTLGGINSTLILGDGSAPITIQHAIEHHAAINYNNVPGSIIPSLGAKLAIVRLSCQSGIAEFSFAIASTLAVTARTAQYIALKVRSQVPINLRIENGQFAPRLNYLRYLDLGGTLLSKVCGNAFRLVKGLEYIKWSGYETGTAANFAAYIFTSSQLNAFLTSNVKINDIDWSGNSTMIQAFMGATGACNHEFIASIAACTNLSNTFAGTEVFTKIVLTNTGNVQNMTQALANSSIMFFSMDDCAGVTNITNLASGNYSGNLRALLLFGLKISLNISGCYLQREALDDLFNSLGTANGAQIITVTGNPGAAACDTSIATNKGFTVVT